MAPDHELVLVGVASGDAGGPVNVTPLTVMVNVPATVPDCKERGVVTVVWFAGIVNVVVAPLEKTFD
jgi:hypothetical protein